MDQDTCPALKITLLIEKHQMRMAEITIKDMPGVISFSAEESGFDAYKRCIIVYCHRQDPSAQHLYWHLRNAVNYYQVLSEEHLVVSSKDCYEPPQERPQKVYRHPCSGVRGVR